MEQVRDMDILNSGSFVTLDNRDKIEQLIFTAKTLATETGRNEGFQNNGLTNQQLALEMWKGAEYMCRSNEEATIKNLFLSNFLQKLNEFVRESAVPRPVSVEAQPAHSVPESQIHKPEFAPANIGQPAPPVSDDEFLGVVSQSELVDEIPRNSYSEECKPECEDEIVEMTNGSATEFVPPQPESIPDLDAVPAIVTTSEVASTEKTSVATEPAPESVQTESPHPRVESIVLAEKEPFNFEACTVTAVVQLLPVNEGYRKCVVSVRSHEFLPQITIDNLVSAHINDEIKRSLDNAFARYRTELPALAADKIKQEAQSKKKRATKASDASQAAKTTISNSTISQNKSIDSKVESGAFQQAAEPAKDQQTLFAQ